MFKFKKKRYILIGIFLFLFLLTATILIKTAKAETTSNTFPVDEAGIAAYAKLNEPENINLSIFANACDSIEKLGESYMIGTIKIQNTVGFTQPHIYVGADGWIVAYYLKTEEASRIMQWNGYEAGSLITTTLQDAIDVICAKTGASYALPLKYYDFEFPEANKMTIVAELASKNNDFYVTVPGTLYEASYQVMLMQNCGGGSSSQTLTLTLDDIVIFKASGGGLWTLWRPFASYGYYDTTLFTTGTTHHIAFGGDCYGLSKAYATVLIYKN